MKVRDARPVIAAAYRLTRTTCSRFVPFSSLRRQIILLHRQSVQSSRSVHEAFLFDAHGLKEGDVEIA
jgi:hypothetical protein